MKKLRKYSFFPLIIFLFLISPDTSWAWGIIQGVVRSMGVPVSGALVETEYASITTWTDGSYQMFHLPGTYTITASASGYVAESQQVTVTDVLTTHLDFPLQTAPVPNITSVSPNLGELGRDLTVTINGSGFDKYTRLSMYPVNGNNRSKIIGGAGTLGYAYGVTVIGNTAYVADGSGLQLVDVSNPTNPIIIEPEVDTPGEALKVTVIGDIAYVADYTSGLQLVDVNPTSSTYLQIIGPGVDTQGEAWDVTVIGDIAYVANGTRGLRLVDVNPISSTYLQIIGSMDIPGAVYGVTVIEDIAYVAAHESGLHLVDVNPTSSNYLQIIGSVDIYTAWNLTVIGDIAYVTEDDAINPDTGLQLVDVNPTSSTYLQIIGSVDIPGAVYGVTVIEDIAYVTDRIGLQMIEVSDLAHPTVIGWVETPDWAYDVTVIGNIAYVADKYSGLQVVNVSAPMPPVIIGSVESQNYYNWISDVTVIGDKAYVSSGAFQENQSAVYVVDLSDPTHPAIIGSVDIPGSAEGITVIGDIAYVADSVEGLLLVDVDPTSPTYLQIIGSTFTPGSASGVTVQGGIAYVAVSNRGLRLVDVNPASSTYLQIIGGVETSGWAFGVTVIGDIAYVAGDQSGLYLVDVNPASSTYLQIIGGVDTPGRARGVSVLGDIAYVADFSSGVQVIDVNPASSNYRQIIGSVDTPGVASGVTVQGDIAYVADGGSGVQMIDISDPTNPVIIGSYSCGRGSSHAVKINGELLYIANEDNFVIGIAPKEINSVNLTNETQITATLSSPIKEGNYILRAFNNVQYSELPGAVTFTTNADILHARAIIVAGGGPDAPGDIWEETRAYAQEAYNSLIYQGYRAENISYLTDDASAAGRSGPSEKDDLMTAITDWADNDPATKSLVLYLVDHGEEERFQLRGNTNPDLSEYATAGELDTWLDVLQANTGIKVLVVYDACRSGSFVSRIQERDDTRVVITSVGQEEAAYFLDLKHSFSGVFWGTLSGRTGSMGTLSNAWTLAKGNMANYQSAQLDANGNGVANQPEDIEAMNNNIFEIGREWFNAEFSRPVVNVAAADQALNGETSATLSARGIYDLDPDDAIVRVWAEVIRPDFVPTPGVTVTSLPTVDLTDPDADGIYTAVFPDDAVESYPGFDVNGTYIVSYYAEDSKGVYSEPKVSLVTQNGGTPVVMPDQYEDDDTAAAAGVIFINHPAPEEHSFHDNDDEDWVQFYGIAGQLYNIRAMNPTIISDPMISIFSSDNLATPLISSNTAGAGVEEAIMGWLCPEDGLYFVRLMNTSGHAGANVRYQLKIYNPVAFSMPGYVTGTVSAGGSGVGGVVLVSGGGSAVSRANGSYLLSLEPGTHTMSVSKTGYQSMAISVTVPSGGSITRNIELTPNVTNSPPTISGSPPTSVNTFVLYSFTPVATDPDGDILTFSITNKPGWADFNTATGNLSGLPTTSGSYGPITITVSDGQLSASLPAFTITVAAGGNLPPTISGTPPQRVGANRQYTFTPIVSDPNGDSLSLFITNKPGWAQFNAATGTLSGIPGEENIGSYGPITIGVRDAKGASASLPAFSIEVVPDIEIDKYGVMPSIYLLLRKEK